VKTETAEESTCPSKNKHAVVFPASDAGFAQETQDPDNQFANLGDLKFDPN
jgi:hypothetical protein